MATFAVTAARIADDLSRNDVTESINREILSAVEYYVPLRLGFNERVLSFSLSATNTYTLASIVTGNAEVAEVLAVDDVRYTVSSRYVVMDPLAFAEWRRLDTTTSETAPPDYFGVFNKSLYVYPKPDQTYAATMAAHVRLHPLLTTIYSGDGGSTAITENAWLQDGLELIQNRATRMVLAKKLDDFEKSNVYAGLEAEALARLVERRNLLLETGRLTPQE